MIHFTYVYPYLVNTPIVFATKLYSQGNHPVQIYVVIIKESLIAITLAMYLIAIAIT